MTTTFPGLAPHAPRSGPIPIEACQSLLELIRASYQVETNEKQRVRLGFIGRCLRDTLKPPQFVPGPEHHRRCWRELLDICDSLERALGNGMPAEMMAVVEGIREP